MRGEKSGLEHFLFGQLFAIWIKMQNFVSGSYIFYILYDIQEMSYTLKWGR